MSSLPLPAQTERLSSAGFDRVYKLVRDDPERAKAIAQLVEADPRSALHHVFRLTKAQREAIENTSDEELRRRAAKLIADLRSASPGKIRFDPGPRAPETEPSMPRVQTCGCIFIEGKLKMK